MVQVLRCDGCKTVHKKDVTETGAIPGGWIQLRSIELNYSPSDGLQPLHPENRLLINPDNDPDFCSKKCLLLWLDKETNKIMVVKKGI